MPSTPQGRRGLIPMRRCRMSGKNPLIGEEVRQPPERQNPGICWRSQSIKAPVSEPWIKFDSSLDDRHQAPYVKRVG